MKTHPLVDAFRCKAELLAKCGAPQIAHVWRLAADELEAHDRAHWLESLTLKEAATESGYSEAHLSRLIAEARIENTGKKGAPRLRRGDLPRKPSPPALTGSGAPDLVQLVLGRPWQKSAK